MRIGKQRAEHDRTEHQPRDHLADHRWLSEALQQRTTGTRANEDHAQLQQEEQGRVHAHVAGLAAGA